MFTLDKNIFVRYYVRYTPTNSSSSSLQANKIPDPSEWNLDPKSWVDDAGDSCQDFEESGKLPVPVNFEYVKDSNGNPTLIHR